MKAAEQKLQVNINTKINSNGRVGQDRTRQKKIEQDRTGQDKTVSLSEFD